MKLFFLLYLGTLAASSVWVFQDTELQESMKRGQEVYSDFCVTCHLDSGQGVEGVFPPLAQSDYLLENRNASILGIKNGQNGEIVVNGLTYNNTMMPMGLEDEEVADVMNYILNNWGNKSEAMVTAAEVAALQSE